MWGRAEGHTTQRKEARTLGSRDRRSEHKKANNCRSNVISYHSQGRYGQRRVRVYRSGRGGDLGTTLRIRQQKYFLNHVICFNDELGVSYKVPRGVACLPTKQVKPRWLLTIDLEYIFPRTLHRLQSHIVCTLISEYLSSKNDSFLPTSYNDHSSTHPAME